MDWYIGKRCNFDCCYCGPRIHDNSSSHQPLESMIRAVTKIQSGTDLPVAWSLTGGEPTLNPKFIDLCRHIKQDEKSFISVTTNGSKSTAYYLELFNFIDDLTLSVHFEFVTRFQPYINKITEINRWLKESGAQKSFRVRLMAFPGKIDDLLFLREQISKLTHTSLEVRVVKGKRFTNHKDPSLNVSMDAHYPEWYSHEEKERLKKYVGSQNNHSLRMSFKKGSEVFNKDYNFSGLVMEKLNSFKGWECWAGVKLIRISPDGTIYRGNCLVGGAIGNINDPRDSWKLPRKPITCTKQFCGDVTDLRMPKVFNDEPY